MDATEITAKNLKIAELYTKTVASLADGVLLSGSNAWGANYAVTATSDIDLLITAGVEKLEKIIERLISRGLLEEGEEKRWNAFRTFYSERKAEQFSTIAALSDTNISLDFIPWEIVEDICSLAQMKTRVIEGVRVRTIKELRINPPKSTGYSVDDLSGQRKLTYHANFEEVSAGYLADTLVDAQTESSYCMGVMSFFFAVYPSVLFDKQGKLANEIKTLQSTIAQLSGGKAPVLITRQESMSAEVLSEVKTTLTY